MEHTITKVVQTEERLNSWEFGPASSRHKIYYTSLNDLKDKVSDAMAAEVFLSSLEVKE